MAPVRLALALLSFALLSGCEIPGVESAEKIAAIKEAEGKAVGSACRHALRAIEDCYALNARAQKSSIFAGWREMDEYMRENKIEGLTPVVARATARAEPAAKTEPAAAADSKAGNERKAVKPAHTS